MHQCADKQVLHDISRRTVADLQGHLIHHKTHPHGANDGMDRWAKDHNPCGIWSSNQDNVSGIARMR